MSEGEIEKRIMQIDNLDPSIDIYDCLEIIEEAKKDILGEIYGIKNTYKKLVDLYPTGIKEDRKHVINKIIFSIELIEKKCKRWFGDKE